MKRLLIITMVFVCLVMSASIVTAHGGQLIANKVDTVPVIDGQGDDSAWQTGIRYPMAFNQLNERDQVWTDLQNLTASVRLVYNGNTLYGIVYRQDNMLNLTNTPKWECDSIDIFFDFKHEVLAKAQSRALVNAGFGKIAGAQPQSAWNKEGTIFEFAIDLTGAGIALATDYVMGFNIAMNDADEGGRHTQLYPFPGNNTSSTNPASLGDLLFK